MSDIHSAFCRFCHAFCAINVEVDNGRIVNIIGDKNNPMYHGYTCIKGSQLASQHYNPERLTRELWHSIPGASVFLIPPLDRWPLHSCRQSIHPCSFQVAVSTNLASPLPRHCAAGGMPALSHSPKQTYGCWWVPIRLYQCGEEFLNIIPQSACMIWTQGLDGAPRKRVFNWIASG